MALMVYRDSNRLSRASRSFIDVSYAAIEDDICRLVTRKVSCNSAIEDSNSLTFSSGLNPDSSCASFSSMAVSAKSVISRYFPVSTIALIRSFIEESIFTPICTSPIVDNHYSSKVIKCRLARVTFDNLYQLAGLTIVNRGA